MDRFIFLLGCPNCMHLKALFSFGTIVSWVTLDPVSLHAVAAGNGTQFNTEAKDVFMTIITAMSLDLAAAEGDFNTIKNRQEVITFILINCPQGLVLQNVRHNCVCVTSGLKSKCVQIKVCSSPVGSQRRLFYGFLCPWQFGWVVSEPDSESHGLGSNLASDTLFCLYP